MKTDYIFLASVLAAGVQAQNVLSIINGVLSAVEPVVSDIAAPFITNSAMQAAENAVNSALTEAQNIGEGVYTAVTANALSLASEGGHAFSTAEAAAASLLSASPSATERAASIISDGADLQRSYLNLAASHANSIINTASGSGSGSGIASGSALSSGSRSGSGAASASTTGSAAGSGSALRSGSILTSGSSVEHSGSASGSGAGHSGSASSSHASHSGSGSSAAASGSSSSSASAASSSSSKSSAAGVRANVAAAVIAPLAVLPALALL